MNSEYQRPAWDDVTPRAKLRHNGFYMYIMLWPFVYTLLFLQTFYFYTSSWMVYSERAQKKSCNIFLRWKKKCNICYTYLKASLTKNNISNTVWKKQTENQRNSNNITFQLIHVYHFVILILFLWIKCFNVQMYRILLKSTKPESDQRRPRENK